MCTKKLTLVETSRPESCYFFSIQISHLIGFMRNSFTSMLSVFLLLLMMISLNVNENFSPMQSRLLSLSYKSSLLMPTIFLIHPYFLPCRYLGNDVIYFHKHVVFLLFWGERSVLTFYEDFQWRYIFIFEICWACLCFLATNEMGWLFLQGVGTFDQLQAPFRFTI